MTRIAWNTPGTRIYEAGVDRGVLYLTSTPGIPWIGLISVEEASSGGEPKPLYIDGVKYLNRSSAEEFEATITAFTYPVEFSQCDGTGRVRDGLFFGQQKRRPFGFSYRTMVGNDLEGSGHGYKIHLVYNALAAPSSRSMSSYSDSVEASEFSWEISTKPRFIAGRAPTAHVVVDTRYTHPRTLSVIEDILYGTADNVARLPTPEELISIFDTPVEWKVTDNGDGTFLIEGPDENVRDIGLGMVMIDHPSITVVDEDTFTITY